MSEEYSVGYSEGHQAGRNEAIDECATELTRLRAEYAELKAALGQPVPLSDWQKMEQQSAELAALIEAQKGAIDAALRHLRSTSYHPVKDRLFDVLQSVENPTAPDALKAHDAALLRKAADASEAFLTEQIGCHYGSGEPIRSMAEAVEKGEPL